MHTYTCILNLYWYSQRKAVFYLIQCKNGFLAASDLFHICLHNEVLYIPLSHIKKYRGLKSVIRQIDSKNE